MSDQESFLSRLRKGEPDACELLIEQFEDPLFRFFVCDHRDYHLAQEQTAETFAQLICALPKMKGHDDQLRAFVFSIARHVRFRYWRQPSISRCNVELVKSVSDPQPSPEHQLADREQLERILEVISQFDSPLRDILILRFVEELSVNEVASAMALPVGTVKSHIHRGIAKLKMILSDSECKT
ncbi:MAG: sigma-70 family RNA polymerase sigma factor [Planctomycetaceae bacterium]|nr:sigma-70 family RNA polymerase sigma factor [Planctomycetaceae bacterium]